MDFQMIIKYSTQPPSTLINLEACFKLIINGFWRTWKQFVEKLIVKVIIFSFQKRCYALDSFPYILVNVIFLFLSKLFGPWKMHS